MSTYQRGWARQIVLTNYLHGELWSVVGSRGYVFNFAEREHAVNDSAEDDMLSVQEVAFCGCDEELAPVRIRAGVGL